MKDYVQGDDGGKKVGNQYSNMEQRNSTIGNCGGSRQVVSKFHISSSKSTLGHSELIPLITFHTFTFTFSPSPWHNLKTLPWLFNISFRFLSTDKFENISCGSSYQKQWKCRERNHSTITSTRALLSARTLISLKVLIFCFTYKFSLWYINSFMSVS